MDRKRNTDDLRGINQLLKPYAWVGEMGWSKALALSGARIVHPLTRRRKAESGR